MLGCLRWSQHRRHTAIERFQQAHPIFQRTASDQGGHVLYQRERIGSADGLPHAPMPIRPFRTIKRVAQRFPELEFERSNREPAAVLRPIQVVAGYTTVEQTAAGWRRGAVVGERDTGEE